MVAVLIFFCVHWYLSLFSQTFFLHRYSAHKMFDMNKFWEKFFYIFTWLTQGSSFLSPRAYAILHRMHHAYSDTEKDPHSPHFHSNVFTMMWKTKAIYNTFLDKNTKVEERFSKDIPCWDFVEKLGDNWISRIAWGTGYAIFYIIFADYWWLYLLLPIHFLMGPVHGAIVNWFGHKLGYANFDNNDKSKNTLVVDILMGGELFQNNHHKHADSPNFAKKWYEFDPTYPVMKVLDWVHIIKIRTRLKTA
ncbi:MAG TPA: acyl-CoA desaturase [Cytophagaceae bacterium]|nr:acyl-CoA desaturase [Cytophagaceae bacterium]